MGAHCDDIEIGCGGTILNLVSRYPDAHYTWVVFSSNPTREKEALDCAQKFLGDIKNQQIIIKQFRNGYFPYVGAEIKDYFEELKSLCEPDVIFTHYRHDLHQDHRTLSDLTWNTYRNHLILEYEIPKYDGDSGSPNFFVPVTKQQCDTKITNILTSFATQNTKQWFTSETFQAILRLRGIESNSPSGYAEGFYCRKISI